MSNPRDELRAQAEAVLTASECGRYTNPRGAVVDFSAAQRAAEAGSRCYRPAELAELHWPAASALPIISVGEESTSAAARRLVVGEGKRDVALLNFASARNPGGGFLGGARAQEEDLCRSSGLYRCQLQAPEYYEANRGQKSLLYTDHLIYSPAVPFFQVNDWLDDYFCVDVITAPAPNAGAHLQKHPEDGPAVLATLRRRAGYVLDLAAARGCRHLILGAWGCGVFRNNPRDVVAAWADGLAAKAYPFASVHFAIYDRSPSQSVLHAFRERFG